MIKGKVELATAPFLETFKRGAIERVEQAALFATDKAIKRSQRELRASLGEVGNGRVRGLVAITSDLKKGRVFRFGAEGFSASGFQYQAKRGDRIDGIFESYGRGAEILPRKSEWLWFATPELGIKRVGRKKITPALYNAAGLDKRIGPLVKIPGRHPGEALLIVNKVSTPVGRSGRIKRLPRNGMPRGNRQAQESVVAFIGIKRTTRYQRFDAQQILRESAAQVPNYVNEYLRKGR